MKKHIIIVILFLIPFLYCDSGKDDPNRIVISKKFIDENNFEIICRGLPLEGSEGIEKEESAKRAALLNIYYFSKKIFKDSVSPEIDGSIEEVIYNKDDAIVRYIITKRNLKGRMR